MPELPEVETIRRVVEPQIRGRAIENVLRVKVIDLPVDPQLMGALGAAEYARQKGLE